MQRGDIHLEEVIRGVVHQHDESSSTDVVNTPGEADEEDGRYMVNNLLLKVLKRGRHSERRHGSYAEKRKCRGYIYIYMCVLHFLSGSVYVWW